jgi:hypothetical protein
MRSIRPSTTRPPCVPLGFVRDGGESCSRGVSTLSRGPAWTTTGPGRSPARDRQAAGWLKVPTSRPNASMWSLIEKATTAPRVVAGRPRLGTSSAKTVNR